MDGCKSSENKVNLTTKGRDFITVVSGLPRSGTSMMMRMLEAGGMPVLTDNVRQADADNPNGYYEFERVKQLPRDTSWLRNARGKAVKLVYRLLCNLPEEYEYRVVMMNRRIAEVVASQDAMLQHRGEKLANTLEVARILKNDLENVQQWVQSQPNFVMINVNYNSMILELNDTASELVRFLDSELDTYAMTTVLDLSLYRHKLL
jgi:hypothetical protein